MLILVEEDSKMPSCSDNNEIKFCFLMVVKNTLEKLLGGVINFKLLILMFEGHKNKYLKNGGLCVIVICYQWLEKSKMFVYL